MKRIGLLVDLVLLATSLATGGPVARQAQAIVIVAAAVVVALVLFAAGSLVVALVSNYRRPPFPMVGGRDA